MSEFGRITDDLDVRIAEKDKTIQELREKLELAESFHFNFEHAMKIEREGVGRESDELREKLAHQEKRIIRQRSEIKNRLIQIYGMERENSWLRGIRKRVRTALGLDGETLLMGISDPAEAAKRICSERDELRSKVAELEADKERLEKECRKLLHR